MWLGEDDLTGALAAACEGGATVIFDPLFGPPLEAAIGVAAPDARIVQVGASAGPTATLPSAAIRGRALNLLGYANRRAPRPVIEDAYRTMVGRLIDGQLDVEVTVSPLAEIERVWQALREGGAKHVLVP